MWRNSARQSNRIGCSLTPASACAALAASPSCSSATSRGMPPTRASSRRDAVAAASRATEAGASPSRSVEKPADAAGDSDVSGEKDDALDVRPVQLWPWGAAARGEAEPWRVAGRGEQRALSASRASWARASAAPGSRAGGACKTHAEYGCCMNTSLH